MTPHAPDTPHAPPSAAPDPAGSTILVVDDEVLIRMTLAEELADSGYACLTAGNGAEALRLLDENPAIALLVSDLGLPGGMDGRELAETARAVRPGLPVLFVTGYADQADLAVAAGPGHAVMAKPFRTAELLAKVRSLLGG